MKRLGQKPEKTNIKADKNEKSCKVLRMVNTDDEAVEKN